jgi:hypothetical protein
MVYINQQGVFMARIIEREKMCEIFKKHLKNSFQTQSAAAKHYCVSVQFMSGVYSGRVNPTAAMLSEVGIVKKSVYLLN